MELIRSTIYGTAQENDSAQTAYKAGFLVWRLTNSAPKADSPFGCLRWQEGAEAYNYGEDNVIRISAGGGGQGDPGPLTEEIIAGIFHPYRLDPRRSEHPVKSKAGKLNRVVARFGAYVVTADYNDAYEGMLWNFSVARDGEKPQMANLPDEERWEFRDPAMVDGRWHACQLDVVGEEYKSRYRVERLSFTNSPGVAKPDWLKGRTSVADLRFEPSRTYQVDELRRRFKASWPPSLEDLFEFGKETGG